MFNSLLMYITIIWNVMQLAIWTYIFYMNVWFKDMKHNVVNKLLIQFTLNNYLELYINAGKI